MVMYNQTHDTTNVRPLLKEVNKLGIHIQRITSKNYQ